ncbi:MAG: hypothetical protein GY760_29460 [Deltaproteobacteria bacterium]|nr:hypothetical protein [Deltaproteobacteria bacterium]
MVLRKALITYLAGFYFIFLSSNIFASSYGDTYGFSTNGISMGNAMVSHVDDWSSVYYNIAGLGRTPEISQNGEKLKSEIAVNFLYTSPRFDIDIDRSVNGDEDLDFGIVMLGAALDINNIYELPGFISTARIGFSLGLNSDMSVVNLNDLEPQTHNFMRYGDEARRSMILVGAGFGFMDNSFGFGLGANISFGGDGDVLLRDVNVSTEEQVPEGQSKMTLKSKPSLLAGIYIDYGIYDLGLCYRQKSKLEISPFNTVAVTNAGNINLNLVLSIFDYFQPDMFVFGSSVQSDDLLISFDLEYQMWSDFEVSSAQEYNFQSIIPELRDILVVKLGADFLFSENTNFLCGYIYQPSFIPDSATNGVVNFLDNNKHIGSLGIKYQIKQFLGFKGPVELSAGYQFQYLEKRDVVKSSPTTENPNYSYGGICHSFTFGFSLKL